MDIRLAKWEQLFPLHSRSFVSHYDFSVRTPAGLSHVLQARKLLGLPDDLGTPTCVLLPSRGNASEAKQSKIGGVPYRDRRIPWPTNAKKEPLVFFAQINFEECMDVFSDTSLPASILLLFTDGLYLFSDEEPPFFHFEWVGHVPEEHRVAEISPRPSEEPHPAGIMFREAANIVAQLFGMKPVHPPPRSPFQAYSPFFFQQPYRLTEAEPDGEYLKRAFDFLLDMKSGELDHDVKWGAKEIVCLCGIKLGGIPFFYDKGEVERPVQDHWKFLFSLCAIGPPFENAPEPESEYCEENRLVWFDGFQINFFLDENNTIRWTLELN